MVRPLAGGSATNGGDFTTFATGEVGKLVHDYWIISHGWNLDVLEDFLLEEYLQRLLVYLSDSHAVSDKLKWNLSSSGTFNSASAYHILVGSYQAKKVA